MGVNLLETTFADIAEKDLSRVKTARFLLERSPAGPSGQFCLPLVGWRAVRQSMQPTALICSTPLSVLNRKYSTGVMQCS